MAWCIHRLCVWSRWKRRYRCQHMNKTQHVLFSINTVIADVHYQFFITQVFWLRYFDRVFLTFPIPNEFDPSHLLTAFLVQWSRSRPDGLQFPNQSLALQGRIHVRVSWCTYALENTSIYLHTKDQKIVSSCFVSFLYFSPLIVGPHAINQEESFLSPSFFAAAAIEADRKRKKRRKSRLCCLAAPSAADRQKRNPTQCFVVLAREW